MLYNVPSVPTLYRRLLLEIQSDDPSMEVIGEIIARDGEDKIKVEKGLSLKSIWRREKLAHL